MQMMGRTEEQKQMKKWCHDFVDSDVIPFIRKNREREWTAPPEERLPWELLKAADKLGLRSLGVPEKYGGIKLDKQAETFALIAQEMGRGGTRLAHLLG